MEKVGPSGPPRGYRAKDEISPALRKALTIPTRFMEFIHEPP